VLCLSGDVLEVWVEVWVEGRGGRGRGKGGL
jgi:hypothetical protein